MRTAVTLLAAFTLALPLSVSAQSKDSSSASSGASGEMHNDMMKGAKESMSMKPTGDVDQDFVKMMRHHHQTGIRMAQQEVKNGKDPEVRALAQKILKGQQEEAKELERLAESGSAHSSSGKTSHGAGHSK